jgi:hypothetical protein
MTARRPRAHAGQPQPNDDPVLAYLADAPDDDEPTSDDDRQAIAEAWQAYRDGDTETVPAKSRSIGSAAG